MAQQGDYRNQTLSDLIMSDADQLRTWAEQVIAAQEQQKKLMDMAQERFLTGEALSDDALIKQQEAVRDVTRDPQIVSWMREIEQLDQEEQAAVLHQPSDVANYLHEDRVQWVMKKIQELQMRQRVQEEMTHEE